MPEQIKSGFSGATSAAGGTRVASIKPMGSNSSATTDFANDRNLLVRHGNALIPVTTAINMGLVVRQGTSLVEVNGPGAAVIPG